MELKAMHKGNGHKERTTFNNQQYMKQLHYIYIYIQFKVTIQH